MVQTPVTHLLQVSYLEEVDIHPQDEEEEEAEGSHHHFEMDILLILHNLDQRPQSQD